MKWKRLIRLAAGLLLFLVRPSAVWAFHNWQRVQLPNGLTLLVVEKPGAPVVSVTLLVNQGATSDPPGKSGLAFLTAHLLAEGTRQRSGDQIVERIAALGGEFVEEVSADFTTLDWPFLKEDLTSALEVLADIVQYPVFPQAAFDQARNARLAEREAEKQETPEALVLRHFFGRGPYGLPLSGDVTSLKQIVREDVIRFYRQAYRPEETVLTAAGDVTLEEIAALVKKDFGDWSAAEKTTDASLSLSIRQEPAALVINRPLVQASVYLTFVSPPAASPDILALSLLSHLLAGSAESRLGQKLREQKGWTYGVRSEVEAWRQTGLFSLTMSVPYEVVLPALEEAVRELVRVRTILVPEEELQRAKQEFPARFYFETESVRDISHFLAVHEAFTRGQEPPDHALAALQRVTAEEVQKVARRYLDPQKAVVTVVGDRQALEKYAPYLIQGKLPQWGSTDSGKEEER
jgi:zinc protease